MKTLAHIQEFQVGSWLLYRLCYVGEEQCGVQDGTVRVNSFRPVVGKMKRYKWPVSDYDVLNLAPNECYAILHLRGIGCDWFTLLACQVVSYI